MQGLAGYHDNSPPSSPPPPILPSRGGQSLDPSNDVQSVLPSSTSTPKTVDRREAKGKGKAVPPQAERAAERQSSPNRADAITGTSSTAGPSRPRSPPIPEADPILTALPENDPFEGMSEEEIFRIVSRPDEIDGVTDWGIPPEVDPDQASEALKAKVQQFLRLKYERGQHINTSLLSSNSFANPHIYSKLVEFVDIDERATAFPDGGWLTRRNIEDLIPDYGPKSLSATQKAKQEAIKRSQEAGKRSNIQFAPGRRREDERGGMGSAKKRSREDEYRDRERERDRYRGKDRRYDAQGRERDGRDRR